jgi:hypothetical protein
MVGALTDVQMYIFFRIMVQICCLKFFSLAWINLFQVLPEAFKGIKQIVVLGWG